MAARASAASADAPVAILGAGPYGLAVAAHLKDAGIPFQSFGRPMELWREHMPAGMLLRSRQRATHISHPGGGLAIDDFAAARGREVPSPTPLDDFVAYGEWFQQQVVPDLDQRLVERVEPSPGGYRLTLEGSEELAASRVVVAAGMAAFPRYPAEFASLPRSVVSHASEHADLSDFAGRSVAVIGLGQSALESAALLHEGGAEVEGIGRAAEINWLHGDTPGQRRRLRRRMAPPTDVGGRVTGWIAALPDLFRRIPSGTRELVERRCIPPAGAAWLRPRLEDVPIVTDAYVTAAQARDGGVHLLLSNGAERQVDHVLLGTGYQIDVTRYPFLTDEVRQALVTVDGLPRLNGGFESSVPGLHFVGSPAALSFGPVMRFVSGTWYTAPVIAAHLKGRRRVSWRPAFPPAATRRAASEARPARA